MKIKLKAPILAIFLLVAWIMTGFLFHWFPLPEDREFESKIKEQLLQKKSVDLNQFIGEGERICFSGFYATPDSLKEPIPDAQRYYINQRVKGFFGPGDHVWWVYILKDDSEVTLYRMTNMVHPHFRGSRCVSYANKSSRLKMVKSDDYTVFFEIEQGE
jgi:hypothetical protein